MLFYIATDTDIINIFNLFLLLAALLGDLKNEVPPLDLCLEFLVLLLLIHHSELLVMELWLVVHLIIDVDLFPAPVAQLLGTVPAKHILSIL